ncbi:glycine--tRNA ligase subunit beta [Dechloromonas sp. XY25]|uniref:Glycine--tRNA ligase beta subunit n=1 Tax=Dechloromonas hankyongensis TaxID=2908002 RepID=A0ABS9JZY7_9RHOO|nr:glycine--tRNA ligase subunit beta [Dechloromonas hankyongensis]MCG2576478.1 glycine--tRNA ligase subunit beta [Dechloromonas hankyongensis]
MTAKNLLVELFVEELPPKALKKLGEAFSSALANSLKKDGLAGDNAAVTAYASPRRLAAHITGVQAVAADKPVVQKLMPVAVGLDAAGNATPALLKKLSALGADASAVASLRRENDGKADILFYDSLAKGATLAEGLQKAVETALAALPIPKVMTYQLADGWSTVNFVRPAHALVALHGADIVPVAVLGLESGRATKGHRFEAAIDPVVIADADSYAATLLKDGSVIASFAERKAEIARQLEAAAAKAGGKPIDDDALLDEVTALVERPNVLIGQFEAEFLAVPQECLILTMKANQKYFPLLDAAGKLTNKFLVVSNISPDDASAVIGGNERVVRPRLADAKFFFDQDRKKSLESRVIGLSKVVYHNKLGTQGERMQRVAAIARAIAEQLGGGTLTQHAEQAAVLAKADLLTDMVGEFPELQGIMGRYYAQHDGLNADVADAVEDHYKPRFAGDSLPRGLVGTVVALADKLETLVGMFGIGQIPTGDRDPFALRRHALGVIRMLAEGDLGLPLDVLLASAAVPFAAVEGFKPAEAALADFIYDRLAGNLREQGYTAQEVDAVVSQRPQRLGDIPKRLAAVRAFSALPEAAALAAANKRVGNILKKVENAVEAVVDNALLKESAEVALHDALVEVVPQADAAFVTGDYTESLTALAALRSPVDAFFDGVMVNADDPALRANRLGLLAKLHAAMNQVADLSKLSA